MFSHVQHYDLIRCGEYNIQLDGNSHFGDGESIPMIDGQAIKSAYVVEIKRAKRSFLQNVQVVKEFGRKAFGTYSPVGSPVKKN